VEIRQFDSFNGTVVLAFTITAPVLVLTEFETRRNRRRWFIRRHRKQISMGWRQRHCGTLHNQLRQPWHRGCGFSSGDRNCKNARKLTVLNGCIVLKVHGLAVICDDYRETLRETGRAYGHR